MTTAAPVSEKLPRHEAILRAAAELFDRSDFAGVSMSAVAEHSGIAKGTVYLYFPSKEALFLRLLLNEAAIWFEDLGRRLAAMPDRAPLESIARAISTTLAARPRFSRLLAILSSVLERNLDVATIRAFKFEILQLMVPAAADLEARVPSFLPGDGSRFLLRLHAMVVGLYPLAHPAPPVAEALEDPALQSFVLDFDREFSGVTCALLHGWNLCRGASPEGTA